MKTIKLIGVIVLLMSTTYSFSNRGTNIRRSGRSNSVATQQNRAVEQSFKARTQVQEGVRGANTAAPRFRSGKSAEAVIHAKFNSANDISGWNTVAQNNHGVFVRTKENSIVQGVNVTQAVNTAVVKTFFTGREVVKAANTSLTPTFKTKEINMEEVDNKKKELVECKMKQAA